MVKGLDLFKKYFEHFPNNYVIIGGTACAIIINEAGFKPRSTKDIDIIIVIEALSSEFVQQFWRFVHEGKYQQREKSNQNKEYYRFVKPTNHQFPYQIEHFSRTPDVIIQNEDTHLTPIPVDDDLSSLSAILLNDEYYSYVISHSQIIDGLHHATVEALICLKVKAFLNIAERIKKGNTIDAKHLNKHKADIFRLSLMLTPKYELELPETLITDLSEFVELVETTLPDQAIFREMGLNNIEMSYVFEQFKRSFNLNK